MSNQVNSNRQPPVGTRYLPACAESDILSLTPNVLAVPNVSPAYGEQLKASDGVGVGVFWNRCNGIDVPTVLSNVNYSAAQSPNTVPYWRIHANAAVGGGATRLYSLVDNVIAVNAVVPMNTISTGSALTQFALAVRVYNADGSVFNTYCWNGFQSALYTGGLGTGAPVPFSVSGVVRVQAGKSMSVVILTPTTAWIPSTVNLVYKDFLSPQVVVTPPLTSQIQMPCICEFVKM